MSRKVYHCSHCNIDGHSNERCFTLHPELKEKFGFRKVAAAAIEQPNPEPKITTLKHVCSVVAVADSAYAVMWPVKLNNLGVVGFCHIL